MLPRCQEILSFLPECPRSHLRGTGIRCHAIQKNPKKGHTLFILSTRRAKISPNVHFSLFLRFQRGAHQRRFTHCGKWLNYTGFLMLSWCVSPTCRLGCRRGKIMQEMYQARRQQRAFDASAPHQRKTSIWHPHTSSATSILSSFTCFLLLRLSLSTLSGYQSVGYYSDTLYYTCSGYYHGKAWGDDCTSLQSFLDLRGLCFAH